MGKYGNFLTAFPELFRRIEVWTNPGGADTRTITGVHIPTRGNKLRRFTFTNKAGFSDYGSTAIDYSDDDQLFVSTQFRDEIRVGDYFRDPDDHDVHRVVGKVDYTYSAGYMVFSTERVTGATALEHPDALKVKEAQFA